MIIINKIGEQKECCKHEVGECYIEIMDMCNKNYRYIETELVVKSVIS